MNFETKQVLLAIHHQLCTDSDLDTVTAPEKYKALVLEIERLLIKTEYAYLCHRLMDETYQGANAGSVHGTEVK